MITQVSFVNRNTANSWTQSLEVKSMWDVSQYLLDRLPQNFMVDDTYLVHVMVEDGVSVCFRGWKGNWILISEQEYYDTWTREYRKAMDAKQRQLQENTCQEDTMVSQRRKERYSV